MRRKLGQAIGHVAGHGGRAVHLLARLVFMAGLGLVLAAGVLVWRLAQGPIALPWLVDRLEAAANADGNPTRLHIGQAALAWEGFSQGVDRPLDIVLTDLAIIDRDGNHRADLPHAAVSFSVAGLMLGEILPRSIALDGLHLRGVRAADGTLELDLGTLTETADTGGDTSGLNASAGLADAIAMLAGDLGGGSKTLNRWRDLALLRLRAASATLVDRQLGVVWQVPTLSFEMRRARGGGATGSASLLLGLGDPRMGLELTASLPPGGQRIAVTAKASRVVPSSLATAAPPFAPLAALEAPLDLAAAASIGPALDFANFALTAQLGSGQIRMARGALPIRAATVQLAGTAAAFTVDIPRLELAAGPAAPVSVVTARAEVQRDDQGLTAKITAALDKLAFADVGAIWPDGLGGKTTKKWLAENITDGIAHDMTVALELQAPPDLADVSVTALSGGLQGSDLTVHWLRPIPPLEHGVATLRFLGPDALAIDVGAAQQNGTAVAVSNGRVVISGLSVRDQVADISADLSGPAADVLGVLQNKRLHLFDTRPIEMRAPTGQISGKLAITALPLEDFLTVDMVKLRGSGQTSDLHLGGIAAGRDLDHGKLNFEVNNEALKLRGTADLAGIASDVQVEMDFRPGGPAQVIQKVHVTGVVSQEALAGLGVEAKDVLTGSATVQADWSQRRNNRGEVALRADLGNAALAVTRLNFDKPAGRPATLEARVQLDRDRILGIDRLVLAGSGIDVQGQVDYALGRPQVARLQRLRFGPLTNVTGDLTWPRREGDPWGITLNGAGLDASGEFGTPGRTASTPAREEIGPPWTMDAHIEQVRMGEGRTLYGLALRASSDGRITRQARINGRTAPGGGAFEININPGSKGRELRGTADDAGGLIAALDVISDMRGGRLVLSGVYDDAKPTHPLAGSAEITDFRVHDAPALAKLLQAVTVYGLLDAVKSADLTFSSLTAPFRMTGDILEVQDARAFSPSLGITGKGRFDLARHVMDADGTVVPAYYLNSLLGRIPLVGNLLSAEKGGGLLAVGFSMRGPSDDPSVLVNPLTAVTPGFLRKLFNIFDGTPIVPPPEQPAPPAAASKPAAAAPLPGSSGARN